MPTKKPFRPDYCTDPEVFKGWVGRVTMRANRDDPKNPGVVIRATPRTAEYWSVYIGCEEKRGHMVLDWWVADLPDRASALALSRVLMAAHSMGKKFLPPAGTTTGV